MSDDGATLPVEELVEYCRTQAGLLSGRVETLGEEADDLLDEIDGTIAEMRTRLADHESSTTGAPVSPSTPGSDGPDDAITELEELETDLGEKQALAEATRARMAAVQDLAAAYVELAEALESVADGREALARVVRLERDHDAPAYFDDRRTVLEAVADSDGSSTEE